MKDQLLRRIENREAVLGIVGLGYVGLPIVLETTRVKFRTIGFDIDPMKVERLQEGRSYIHHISSSLIQNLLDTQLFEATTDYSRLREVDAIVICVPTPIG